jgi:hypothetical protein
MSYIDRGLVAPTLNDTSAAASNVTKIQAALDLGGNVSLVGNGTVYINATLKVGDFSKLTIPAGMTLKLVSGTSKTMISTKGRYNSDIQVTSLTASGLTCTAVCAVNHNLSVGDYVCINWALILGYSGVFYVASVPTSTTFTYVAYSTPQTSPSTVCPDAATSIYSAGNYIQARKATVGAQIEVNGILDYDYANNPSPHTIDSVIITMTHCAQCTLNVPGKLKNGAKYGAFVVSFNSITIPEIHFDTHSDGIDFNGPGHNAWVGLLSGVCGDNIVGIGTANSDGLGVYPDAMNVAEGELWGITVDNVHADDSTAAAPVRLYGQSAFPIDCNFGTVSGNSLGSQPPFQVLVDPNISPNGNVFVKKVVVDNLIADTNSTGGQFNVSASGAVIEYAKLGIVCRSAAVGALAAAAIGNSGGTIWTLEADIVHRDLGTTTGFVVYNGGTIENAKIRGEFVNGSGSSGGVVGNGANLYKLSVEGRVQGFYQVFRGLSSGAGPTNASFRGKFTVGNLIGNIAYGSGACTMSINESFISQNLAVFNIDSAGSATLNCFGAGNDYNSTPSPHVTRSASQTVSVFSDELKADVTILARTNGSKCFNTNAAAGTLAQAGVVDCLGTAASSWHLRGNPTLVY